jgi:bacterial/archaeal transporter family-2 protein
MRPRTAGALAGAVLVGVLTAVQARINGSLGRALDDGFVAAFISFGSGFVVVVAVALVLPRGRAGLRRLLTGLRERSVAPWLLLAGFAGAFSVITQTLTVATIGVALFTVGIVAGQTAGGLVLDRLGVGPLGVVAVTVPRVTGAALAVAAAIVCAVAARVAPAWWMLLLPVIAGAGIAWQQATNGRLGRSVASPLTATVVNFAGGAGVLLIAAVVHVAAVGGLAPLPTDAWLYTGGAIGVVYIFLSAAIVRVTGVLLLGLGSVVGLLVTSVMLDAAWPAPSAPPTAIALIAVAVALAGVAIVVTPPRRRG